MLYTLIKHATISQSQSLLEWYKWSDWMYKSKPAWPTRPCLQVLFCVFGCVVEVKSFHSFYNALLFQHELFRDLQGFLKQGNVTFSYSKLGQAFIVLHIVQLEARKMVNLSLKICCNRIEAQILLLESRHHRRQVINALKHLWVTF